MSNKQLNQVNGQFNWFNQWLILSHLSQTTEVGPENSIDGCDPYPDMSAG